MIALLSWKAGSTVVRATGLTFISSKPLSQAPVMSIPAMMKVY